MYDYLLWCFGVVLIVCYACFRCGLLRFFGFDYVIVFVLFYCLFVIGLFGVLLWLFG